MSGNSALKGVAYCIYIIAFIALFSSFMSYDSDYYYGFVIYVPLLCIASAIYSAGNRKSGGITSNRSYNTAVNLPSRTRTLCPRCKDTYLSQSKYCIKCRQYSYDIETIREPEPQPEVSTQYGVINTRNPASNVKKCINCGYQNKIDDAFCINCGRFLDAE